MERDISLQAVVDVVASQVDISPSALARNPTVNELGISSFGVMRLVLALEEHFGVELSGEDLISVASARVAAHHELVQRARPISDG